MPAARVGHVAMPLPGAGNQPGSARCKLPGRSGGSTSCGGSGRGGLARVAAQPLDVGRDTGLDAVLPLTEPPACPGVVGMSHLRIRVYLDKQRCTVLRSLLRKRPWLRLRADSVGRQGESQLPVSMPVGCCQRTQTPQHPLRRGSGPYQPCRY